MLRDGEHEDIRLWSDFQALWEREPERIEVKNSPRRLDPLWT